MSPGQQFNGTAGSVPERYISNAVYSKDLLGFAIRAEICKVIIPLTAKGNLDAQRDADAYWSWADSTAYQA